MAAGMTQTPVIPAADRAAAAKALRANVPRTAHGEWTPPPDRADPVQILADAAVGRLPQLLPVRDERMAASPFAFFRGGAALMAADLATTPVTGLRVQACGDAHVLNFGGFATPERHVIFDVNDFDETLPGPWEWDVKRLATSIMLAGRDLHFKDGHSSTAVLAAMQSYHRQMQLAAASTVLDIWYARLDAVKVAALAENSATRRRRQLIADRGQQHSAAQYIAKYTSVVDGQRRFVDNPPVLYHLTEQDADGFSVKRIFATYAASLAPDRQVLFGRYSLVDCAIHVVGVGSVGTRCAVALLQADDDDFLLLQIKEATRSALELSDAPLSVFSNHGERVVHGQRIMQYASDVFLGWASDGEHDYYVRQLRDAKESADLEGLDEDQLREYAGYCGMVLAQGHARSGDPIAIAAYLGKSDVFDKALVRFALAYADQTESDYRAFIAARAAKPGSVA
jgi:uncharacterized protein (DUF2252 family)